MLTQDIASTIVDHLPATVFWIRRCLRNSLLRTLSDDSTIKSGLYLFYAIAWTFYLGHRMPSHILPSSILFYPQHILNIISNAPLSGDETLYLLQSLSLNRLFTLVCK